MQALTDAERYPLMTPEAYQFLQALRQDPHAPVWNHRCGDRLTASGLDQVREFERRLAAGPSGWVPGVPPSWVYDYARRCLTRVPHYRAFGVGLGESASSDEFVAIPPTGRETLASEPWTIVPDDVALDDLIVYDTSGRTGHPLVVPTHPVVASMYLPLLRAALATRGITLDGGPGRVSIVNACMQRTTFQLVTVSSFLEWAGFAKVNLNAADWRDPDDRVRFLDSCNPEIYTGDPLSFAMLATLALTTRPKALVCTSMELPADVHAHVEARLDCPVIELYSLTESGPVAVKTSTGYQLLRHDLYVEVLDSRGRPCAPGQLGEITLTGGQNPFFPLLRYRTGDRAAMVWPDGKPLLVDLEGRRAMVFRDGDAGLLNNVDIAGALRPLRLPRFHLHQYADGRIVFRAPAGVEAEVRSALEPLFGAVPIDFAELSDEQPGGPMTECTSDIPLGVIQATGPESI